MYSSRIFSALFTAAFEAGLLFLPVAVASGVIRGLRYYLIILVPSLFPFVAFSTYLVKSGISDAMGKFLGPVTRVLFRLPDYTATIILMSMVGGFPVEARGIATLRQQGGITNRRATRIASFCVNAGPAFVTSVVGVDLLGSPTTGALLLYAQLGTFILLGFLLKSSGPGESLSTTPVQKGKYSSSPLIDSTVDVARGTVNLCVFMTLFFVLIVLLCETGAVTFLAQFLLRLRVPSAVCGAVPSVIMEVTGGCFNIAALGGSAMLFTFAMSWGRLRVHFQVLSSLTKILFSRPIFFVHQLIKGVFSAIFVIILFQIFSQAIPTFENASRVLNREFSGTPVATAALIVLCIVLLCSVEAGRLEFQEKSYYNDLKA